MKIKETVGIDISKLNFDVRIHSNQTFKVFENSIKGFKMMTQWCIVSAKSELLKG